MSDAPETQTMGRDPIDSLFRWCSTGYRVVVIAETLAAAGALVEEVAHRAGHRVVVVDGALASSAAERMKVSRVNGRRRVDFAGGGALVAESILGLSLGALRGTSHDIICAPGWILARHRGLLRAVTATSSRVGAGIYVYGLGGELLRERDAMVADLAWFAEQQLGLTLQPWQRRLFEQLVGPGPEIDARPSQDP